MPGIRSNIEAMAGYTPGEQINDPEILKLNTNENPYPPSPKVFEAIQAALNANSLRKYPQPWGNSFRHAASQALDIDPDSIIIGNGSDDILTILTRTFVREGATIVSPTPSYTLYRTLAEIQNAKFVAVPFTSDWKLPDRWPEPDADLTFLPNPNSPSGTLLSHAEISRLTEQLQGPLVLDEAYVLFAERSGLPLLHDHDNIIITRSLSKSHALAGIRFGFGIAKPEIVREMVKVKDSYNCDVLSLAAATAAIADAGYYDDIRDRVIASREQLANELEQLGFEVTPGQANFVWCRHPGGEHQRIADQLKAKKILIRYMSYPVYGDGLRITVGTLVEMDRFITTLKAIL